MSTQTITYDLDVAGAAVGRIDWKKQTDGLFNKTAMLAMMKKQYGAKMGEDWSGGETEAVPITVRTHSSSTGMRTGTEGANTTVQSTKEQLLFRIGRVIRPVMVNINEAQAAPDQADFNQRFERRYVEARASAEREYNQHVIAGGIGAYELSGPNPYSSINGIDRTYGFLEEDAVGSQTRTIGGFSKATYAATAPGVQNAVADVASSFSTAGIAQMRSLRSYILQYGPNADESALYMLMTRAAFDNYNRTLSGREMYINEKDRNGGFITQAFGKVQIAIETYMPISTTYGGTASNTNKMSGAILNPMSIYPKWAKPMNVGGTPVPGGRFERSGIVKLSNQYVWSMEIHIAGNLFISNFADHGLLLNGETW